MKHPPGFSRQERQLAPPPRAAESGLLLVLLVGAVALGTTGCRATRARQKEVLRNGAGRPVAVAPAVATNGTAEVAEPKAAAATRAGGLEWDGAWSNRWRMRKAGDAHDQDLYSLLSLQVGRPETDRVSGRLLGRVTADIDGRGDPESQDVFGSLQDTHGKRAHADLYEASIDVDRPFGAALRSRIGRQYETATPEIAHFDGLRLQSREMGRSKLVAGAFGGVPVRLFEATSIHDRIYGAWAEARPWTDGRVRADWMHVSEDASPRDFDDDLFGLSAWQRFGRSWLFDAGYTRLEDESRDARLRATWNDGRGDWMVQASGYWLLESQRAFAQEFDPLFSTLQQFEPYAQYRLLASKSLGDHVRLDVGGDLRRLEDGDDEGRLNRDYDRGYATVVVSDVLARGLDLSLTGDAWDGGERDIRTWGADLTWTPDDRWRASIGSAYALYKYDVVDDVERDDVRTWYARVRRTLSREWALDVEYAYDDDDFENHQLFAAGATWHF